MSASEGTVSPPGGLLSRGRWIDHWEPEDEGFWQSTGSKIAKKNLIFSIFAEHLGFNIWLLWTIIVINLGNIGIVLELPDQFLLVALPALVGSRTRSWCRSSAGECGRRSAPRCC